MYINCHSYYSLKYGTIPVEGLVKEAVRLGLECIALTDINLISGVFDFVKECKKAGIKPVIGVEFRNGDEFKYICLARNASGFAEINAFLSRYLLDEKPYPLQPPQF